MNFKNFRQEVERVAESKIILNRHSSFPLSAEKLRKRWRSSQSGYCSSTIKYLKKLIYPQRKWISKNLRLEVERVDESEIFLNRHAFFFIFGWEIEEKVPFKPPSTSPLTIPLVFFVSWVQSAKYIFLRRKFTKSYSNWSCFSPSCTNYVHNFKSRYRGSRPAEKAWGRGDLPANFRHVSLIFCSGFCDGWEFFCSR